MAVAKDIARLNIEHYRRKLGGDGPDATINDCAPACWRGDKIDCGATKNKLNCSGSHSLDVGSTVLVEKTLYTLV